MTTTDWPLDQAVSADRLALRELVRGLAIAVDLDGVLLPLSPELDAVWLAVLAVPGGYERLRAAVPGLDRVDVRTAELATAVPAWIARYVERFGPMSGEVVHYWPAARWLAGLGVDPCAVRA